MTNLPWAQPAQISSYLDISFGVKLTTFDINAPNDISVH